MIDRQSRYLRHVNGRCGFRRKRFILLFPITLDKIFGYSKLEDVALRSAAQAYSAQRLALLDRTDRKGDQILVSYRQTDGKTDGKFILKAFIALTN